MVSPELPDKLLNAEVETVEKGRLDRLVLHEPVQDDQHYP
jgi:hypothetical protein